MCTAISNYSSSHYFGRNLDYEHDFGEKIMITPRYYPFKFKMQPNMDTHFSMIGMAVESDDYPLYFDATNEYGLSMAGLNFPGNAHYFSPQKQANGIAPYELIPWILGKCKTVSQSKPLLEQLTLIDLPFNERLPLSPLHWILADQTESIVIESTISGMRIYNNPIGVLTNNPPFDYHIQNLSNYINVTAQEAENRFAPNHAITAYSRGMGGIGLPGDNSSASRFIRAAFTKLNSNTPAHNIAAVTQFFHILNSVYQVDGCTKVGALYEKTLYSSCCDTKRGIYYYTTYENPQISAVDIHCRDLNAKTLYSFPLNRMPQILNSP